MRTLTTLAVATCLTAIFLSSIAAQEKEVEGSREIPEALETSKQETPDLPAWLAAIPAEDIIYFYNFTLLRKLKLGTAPLVNPELSERAEKGYLFVITEEARHWACEQSEAGRGLIGINSEAGIIAFEPGDSRCAETDAVIWSSEELGNNIFISPSSVIRNVQGSVIRSHDPVITWDSHGIEWGLELAGNPEFQG